MLDDLLMAQFAQVEAEEKARAEALDREAKRLNSMIGDNGSPALEAPFGIDATWLQAANEEELARLAKLVVRIERRKQILSETIAERTLIMNRCIRRMRRANGKD